ncbi:helix-turn-helix transcriptional regulator [Roseateles sp. BYS87W]|uniref:Helix-turn-helix transcriptional regulator n=1 Tax=Pelomonas baiyunensis TaxID=3299026 RepID=A0ABW7GXM8_9BURK
MLARASSPSFRDAALERQLGPEFLMNVEQAALYLSVSASTLNHWRSDGKGPRFVKLCGSTRGAIRYRLVDLRDYVDKNTFSSVAEAELSSAMSRVSAFWDDWRKPHPFVAKGPHFLLDSALADRETFLAVLCDPYARVRWLRPGTALKRPWCRPERRAELLAAFLNSEQGAGQSQDVEAAYKKALCAIPEQLWGSHPDLTLSALMETASGGPYPIEVVEPTVRD